MSKVRIILPLICLGLGACTPVDRGFGETVQVANLRQTVNPDGTSPSPGGPLEGGNGKRADTAVGKYEAGSVAQTAAPSSTSGGGGSSN